MVQFVLSFNIVVLVLLLSTTTTTTCTTAVSPHGPQYLRSNSHRKLNETTSSAATPSGYVSPDVRFIVYSNLTDEQVGYVTALDYTEETWNVLGTNMIEYTAFDGLTSDQLAAATQLGFTEPTWDCDQNHYMGYGWSGLVTYEIDQYWHALGWNQSNWEEGGDYPETSELLWDNLTASQQDAATQICYFKESWDGINMEEWDCYDQDHYSGYSWTELELYNIDTSMVELGWNRTTWDDVSNDGESYHVPATSELYWINLTTAQQNAASAICYNQESWDYVDIVVTMDSSNETSSSDVDVVDEDEDGSVFGRGDGVVQEGTEEDDNNEGTSFFEKAWSDIVSAFNEEALDGILGSN